MDDPLSNWRVWGGFGITGVGVIVLTLLLLVGSLTNIEEASFVQKVVIWVLGSGIIGYAHNLAHATQRSWQGEKFKNLSPRAQGVAIGAHLVWFALFVIYALPEWK
jgi:hypothetical protein